jgi:hypothetical protein
MSSVSVRNSVAPVGHSVDGMSGGRGKREQLLGGAYDVGDGNGVTQDVRPGSFDRGVKGTLQNESGGITIPFQELGQCITVCEHITVQNDQAHWAPIALCLGV